MGCCRNKEKDLLGTLQGMERILLAGKYASSQGGRPKFRDFIEMERLLLMVPLLLSDGGFTCGNTTIDL